MKNNFILIFCFLSLLGMQVSCKETTFKGASEPVRVTPPSNSDSDIEPDDKDETTAKEEEPRKKKSIKGERDSVNDKEKRVLCTNCIEIPSMKPQSAKDDKASLNGLVKPLGTLIASSLKSLFNSSDSEQSSSSTNKSGVGAIAILPSKSDPCKVEVQNQPNRIFHKTPFNLASHVYRGTAGYGEHFRSYAVFCQKYLGKQVTVDSVIGVALSKGHIDPDRLDCSYRSSLKSMLRGNCR